MGSLPQEPALAKDLEVTILSSSMLHPPQTLERKSMFLSNIDQVLNFDVQTVHFFPANPDFPPEKAAALLKSALESLLVPYDFLAGRLRVDPLQGRLEIDCNAAGLGFIVASSELSIAKLGDLEFPNPAFRQLAGEPAGSGALGGKHDQPLCVVQVTSFKCGGFAMGVCNNHCSFDGISFRTFLQNLAAQAAGDPLPAAPHNDRRLLAARSQPTVTHSHPELVKHENLPQISDDYPAPSSIMDVSSAKLEFRLFHLSLADISALKQKAAATCKYTPTGFTAVTAHVWRCKVLATMEPNSDVLSTLLFAIDIRPRLNPPLPVSYTGNAVISARGEITRRKLEQGPFGRIVEVVHEAAKGIDDEYVRSVIDWVELHKGIPKGDVFVSSWWKLGFAEVEYPWGRPLYTSPVVGPSKDIVVLFPAMGGVEKGVNVLVALPPGDMEKLCNLFCDLLHQG